MLRHRSWLPHAPPPALAPLQLVAEVAERRAFLEEMRALGQGARHAPAITAEISQRLRQLEGLGVK
jgi:hypothetical protein